MEKRGTPRRHLRVLSYNIHKGFNAGNRRFVLNRIREAIRSVQADLVFLQEVQGHHEVHRKKVQDWPTQPQFEYLADSLWPHFAYGRNSVYTDGHHGNAILSKYPITSWENVDISTNKLERRGLLHAVLQVPHQPKPLHAICVHLGLLEMERRNQAQQICERINSLVHPQDFLVMGGDFNDWRESLTVPFSQNLQVHESFRDFRGAHARSFPSWMPALKLDRIYVRGLQTEKALSLSGRPWNQLSDHLALYAELAG